MSQPNAEKRSNGKAVGDTSEKTTDIGIEGRGSSTFDREGSSHRSVRPAEHISREPYGLLAKPLSSYRDNRSRAASCFIHDPLERMRKRRGSVRSAQRTGGFRPFGTSHLTGGLLPLAAMECRSFLPNRAGMGAMNFGCIARSREQLFIGRGRRSIVRE